MATTATFDTHAFIKQLVATGMPEPQAEAVTNMVRDARDHDMSHLATKADLRAELAETKADLMKWIIGALGVQTLAVLGGLAALLRMAGH